MIRMIVEVVAALQQLGPDQPVSACSHYRTMLQYNGISKFLDTDRLSAHEMHCARKV